MSKKDAKLNGVVFPVTSKGDRSSTETNKNAIAAAFAGIDEAHKQKVLDERNWRFGYAKHVIKSVEVGLKNPSNAVSMAQSGLKYLHENFDFVRGDKVVKLQEAMNTIKEQPYHTGEIKGTKPKPAKYTFEVPYKGKILSGEELIHQLNKWARYGTIEDDCAKAIEAVVKHPEWCDLSDKYFVLLGAGAAMGPFQVLMALGANVIAIDLDREGIWKRLISIARDSSGTLTFPLNKPQQDLSDTELYQAAGCDLMGNTPEVCNWLLEVHSGKEVTVGCYVYLDGDLHVRVSLACDAIIKTLTEKRKGTSVAYLCTPTDCHVIPDAARSAAIKNYNALNLVNIITYPLRLFTKYLQKNFSKQVEADTGDKFSVVDGIVIPQGPNYILAKRLQHWRAIVSREKGCLVSSHIAPSTSTASVVNNRQFAWAYDGMPAFKPMEVFEQQTSNAVMAALLINDLRDPNAAANPKIKLKNPLELFSKNGFHGGVWRCGYKFGTVGEVAAMIHFIKVLRPFILLSILVAVFAVFFYQK